jgi:ribosomal protein S12 methylthiotransferase
VKTERYARFMEVQQQVSAGILQGKIGREINVLVDEIDLENEEAVARSPWDAPEIDGNVFIPGATDLKPGDMVKVRIVDAEEYDLVAELV